MPFYDILVIGGGPAGATAALLLARTGWSVALIESKQFPRRKVCGAYLSSTNWPLFAELGILDAACEMAGPEVHDVGLLVGSSVAQAELPRPSSRVSSWGRALARESLDTLLLARAARAGVDLYQPFTCTGISQMSVGFTAMATGADSQTAIELSCSVLISAHGSWNQGALATQPPKRSPRPSDLFGFKADFAARALPKGLMPLVCFPDGYGGLVHGEEGRTGFSCCIRRDRLMRLSRATHASAGEAVFNHVLDTTPSLDRMLSPVDRQGAWLSAGPIRPGVRAAYRDGVFLVGNAAGEAHPAVAEGISMAMQSAWLLARCLGRRRDGSLDFAAREAAGRKYSTAWRRGFAPRIHAAAAIAHWAMRPRTVRATLPLLRQNPRLLTWGARLSGKATEVVG